jgi:hypothetical protein
MSGLLWQWPQQASVGRVVPKSKFYEHAKVTSRLREAFVKEVDRITWAFKLAPATVNLADSEAVTEIQVFVIEAKAERTVSDQVLVAIDKAVQTPIIFEEVSSNETSAPGSRGAPTRRTRAAYKQLGSRGPDISTLLNGDWVSASAGRQPLPTALDLSGLYGRLLAPLLPILPRPGESMSDTVGRMDRARALGREVETLERRMKAEAQLNRKLDLRRELQALVAQYDAVVRFDGS